MHVLWLDFAACSFLMIFMLMLMSHYNDIHYIVCIAPCVNRVFTGLIVCVPVYWALHDGCLRVERNARHCTHVKLGSSSAHTVAIMCSTFHRILLWLLHFIFAVAGHCTRCSHHVSM